MLVRELVQKLSELDQDAEVGYEVWDGDYKDFYEIDRIDVTPGFVTIDGSRKF